MSPKEYYAKARENETDFILETVWVTFVIGTEAMIIIIITTIM